jgi:hypothetical protein
MRITVFGTYDTSTHPRIETIAEGLASRGFDVAECNAPLGLDTASRVEMLAKPWKVGGLVVRLGSRWLTLARTATPRTATPALSVPTARLTSLTTGPFGMTESGPDGSRGVARGRSRARAFALTG